MSQMPDYYDRIYRKLHPRPNPFCPFGASPSFLNLWPSEQKQFEDLVDAIQAQQESSRDAHNG